MKFLATRRVTVAALAVGLLAITADKVGAADKPGLFLAVDDAAIFSDEGKKRAEKRLAGAKFDRGLHFTVMTVKELPAEWKKKYDDAPGKEAVVRAWAKSVATGDRGKGPLVLICMKPGWTVVLMDEETVNRGFGKTEESALRTIFDTALKEAAKKDGDEKVKHRDAALLKAADFVVNELKGTKVIKTDGTPVKPKGKP